MRYFNEANTPFWEKTNNHLLMLCDELLSSLQFVPPFIITSTWRSPEHNKEVKGVPDSYHLIGAALDIQFQPYLDLPKHPGLKIINYPLKKYSHIQLPERPSEEVGVMEIGISESYPSLSIAPGPGLLIGAGIVFLLFFILLKK